MHDERGRLIAARAMIFDCPRCEVENTVPRSEIPERGKVVTCSGCHQPFRVLPPDPDDPDGSWADEVGPDEETASFEAPEPTRITPIALGAAPVEANGAKPKPLEAPAPAAPAANAVSTVDDRPDPRSDLLETRRIEPGPTGEIPLDSTGRESLGPDPAKGLGRRGRPREAREDDSAGGRASTPPSDRVTGSLGGFSDGQVLAHAPTGRHVLGAKQGPRLRVPLALGVGLAVFPVALAAIFWLRAEDPKNPPIEIASTASGRLTESASAAASQRPAPSAGTEAGPAVEGAATPAPPTSAAGSQAERRTVEAAGGLGISADIVAPLGHAFISADEARLRTQALRTSDAVAKLKGGTVVRRVEQVEAFVLVMVGDKGPVGFVPANALSERLPISALADRHAIRMCSPGEEDDEAVCPSIAAQPGARCKAACDEDAPSASAAEDELEVLRDRCRSACDLAVSRCIVACQAKARAAESKRPKKKQRPQPPLPGF